MTLLALAVGGRGLVDPDEPILHADDEAFLRSRAAFETTRVYGGSPFKLDEHLARLAGSAARVEIGTIDTDELRRLAGLALEAAAAPDAMLRLFVTPGRDGAGSPTHIAMVSTLPDGLEELRARGLKLVSIQLGVDPELRATSPWLLGGVKSTSYAVNMAAEAEAKRRGADDAVFLGSGDVVLEGPVTNVWWRYDDVLYTPALELGILAGVTRATLMEEAAAAGREVREGAFPLEHMAGADEAFTSSSIREVMPVIELDGRPVGAGAPGPAAQELQEALRGAAAR
ncbi:MAG TPA: aminotransferase class IV [Gaiellaceae bacterium]|nr:aminotransferase class IV [Gaiellaceae bacterium]